MRGSGMTASCGYGRRETDPGVGQIVEIQDAVTKRVVDQPERRPGAGKVQLAVEHAMDSNQLRKQVQHLADVPVQETFDALLKEQPATNRRVAFELQPLFWLDIEFTRQRQFPQVKIGAEEAE